MSDICLGNFDYKKKFYASGSTIKPSFLWRVQVPKMFDEVAIASLTYLYFNGVFRRGVKKSGYFTVTKTVKYPFFLDASP